jgi:pterin-4a-carbinolamine dehydratase
MTASLSANDLKKLKKRFENLFFVARFGVLRECSDVSGTHTHHPIVDNQDQP